MMKGDVGELEEKIGGGGPMEGDGSDIRQQWISSGGGFSDSGFPSAAMVAA